MNHNMAHIGCLVCNVAMGRIGKSYRIRVEKWIRTNGPEWTSNRCKAIWNIAMLARSGDYESAIAVCRKNSIAYHKNTQTPKGPEGRLVREFVKAQRPAVLKRIAAVLRVYTSIRLDKVTSHQREKALDAITGPYTGTLPLEDVYEFGRDLTQLNPGYQAALEFCSRKFGENEIHAEHLKVNSRYYSRNKIPKAMRDVPYVSMAMSFMTEPWLPDSIDRQTPCYELREGDRSQGWGESQLYAGKITLLQEQGAKARVVCQPSAWLQLGFVPLHNRLAQVNRILFDRESCVERQSAGVAVATQHLREGGTVYCTDLTSATDRFPVEFSLGVLNALGLTQYESALREVCLQNFQCDFVRDGYLTYSVGQPMGLYGSFPLFHLSNALVARTASLHGMKANQPTFPDGTRFKILGDDIIFSDSVSEGAYRDIMTSFGVGISESKCFHGNMFEFAGFVSLKTNKDVAVFRPYKVPDSPTLTNPIQFLDSLGVKVAKISSRWEERYERYVLTATSRNLDLSPILPTWEENPTPDVRGDNTDLIRICQGLHMWAEESGYTLPDPMVDGEGRPRTRINTNPLFRERGMFDRYVFDPEYLSSNEFRELEKYPGRRRPASMYEDPLMREVRDREDPGYSERLTRLVGLVRPILSQSQTEPEDLDSELDEDANILANFDDKDLDLDDDEEEWEI